ncbi:hypothetical protein [Rahnella aceris]|uniref:hypothetical protein n=1 Tax=Rahnella sp. (strain Y9602) TaxID=2703885 RepID=UPI001F531D19|nr:hypothetical protein [Rahnella aceris]UNK53067.1 hypothetical protein MNO10_20650 [Rahnella aceris]
MSNYGYIAKRIEDSDFLIGNGRYESALLLLLTAIDASAILVFPKGTKSLYAGKSKEDMGVGERYKRFLGVRIPEILGVVLDDNAYYQELIKFTPDKNTPQEMIYTALRCNDVHEGHIPYEYHYIYNEKSASDNISVSFSGSDVVFNSGFLTLLKTAVVDAPCNDKEFGRASYKLEYKNHNCANDYAEGSKDTFKLSPGRIIVLIKLCHKLKKLNPQLNNDDLKVMIINHIEQNENNASYNFSGYYDEHPLGVVMGEAMRDKSGKITQMGKQRLDIIFNDIQFIEN